MLSHRNMSIIIILNVPGLNNKRIVILKMNKAFDPGSCPSRLRGGASGSELLQWVVCNNNHNNSFAMGHL